MIIQRIGLAVLAAAVGAMLLTGPAAAQTATPLKTLVLYDAPPSSPYQKLGFAYAIMLRNLLGHFDSTVDLVPVQSYTAGKLEAYQATFYLGSEYDNPLPSALLSDVAATARTVVWFKHNLWKLAWDPAYNFNVRYGFSFNGLRGMNAAPTSGNPAPGFFDTVQYKGKSMVKYYAYDPASGAINADPDIGITQIIDSAKAQALATLTNPRTGEQAPYAVRSGNFWYLADIPFSYIGPRDRYLAFADLLHDMVGINHAESHRAMVRLEDVGALVDYGSMTRLIDYLSPKRIPFSVATIPRYRDPLGKYNDGVPQDIPLAQAGTLKNALNYALARGGKIVMHGFTHQYNATPNLYTAVSGDDFEFWNAVANTPVAEDSTAWAMGRLQSGLNELTSNGYTPFAWEAPHYQSSPLSILAVPQVFKTTYQRAVYYTSNTPQLAASQGRDYAVGQFFPYVIKKDYYGQQVLPENLGNIEYDIRAIDPTSYITYTWQDIHLNAQYAWMVRDGFASFFFHPFWLEQELGVPGFRDFKSLVEGISGLGYSWVDASTVQ